MKTSYEVWVEGRTEVMPNMLLWQACAVRKILISQGFKAHVRKEH